MKSILLDLNIIYHILDTRNSQLGCSICKTWLKIHLAQCPNGDRTVMVITVVKCRQQQLINRVVTVLPTIVNSDYTVTVQAPCNYCAA